MSEFAKIVRAELIRARAKHKPYNSAHEAYAVILEELDEFWEIVRQQTDRRSRVAMLKELSQIATTAQRAAEDLGLIEPETFES